jgi:membrane protease YdiL (CAAX protease family)
MGEQLPAVGRGAPTAVALVVAALLPSLLIWVDFVVLGGEGVPELLHNAVFAAGKAAMYAFPLAFVVLWERRRPHVAWPRKDGLLLGLVFGLAVAAGVWALYFGALRDSPLLTGTPASVQAVLRKFDVVSAPRFLAMAVGISLGNSLLEEYYFRWFIFGRLRAFLPLPAAVALSAAVFMAHHVILLSVYLPGQFWTLVAPFSLCIAAGGAMWAWLYARTGTLYAPWVSHALIDAALFVVGWDLLGRAG